MNANEARKYAARLGAFKHYPVHAGALDAIRQLADRADAKDAALRAAIALIEKPAKCHEVDQNPQITGTPRYSAGLRVHHRECAELLPVLRAALGDA